ncbi:hypothetical protein KKE14_02185 [Patescibacteria group bacterium]|nr:hypothetical protein [Patescibacteria group bacterium]
MKNLLNIGKDHKPLVLGLAIVLIVVGIIYFPVFKQYFGFQPSSASSNIKEVYTVMLFKASEQVGISLAVKGNAIPSYGKIGEYELKGLAYGRVVESTKFNFDGTIMYDPKEECITENGELITNTSNCQPFEPMVTLDNVTKLVNLEYRRGMNEIQLFKGTELLAKHRLDGKAPNTSYNPFVQPTSNIGSGSGITDPEAERLFEGKTSQDINMGTLK